jgi:hypothetical protein
MRGGCIGFWRRGEHFPAKWNLARLATTVTLVV